MSLTANQVTPLITPEYVDWLEQFMARAVCACSFVTLHKKSAVEK